MSPGPIEPLRSAFISSINTFPAGLGAAVFTAFAALDEAIRRLIEFALAAKSKSRSGK